MELLEPSMPPLTWIPQFGMLRLMSSLKYMESSCVLKVIKQACVANSLKATAKHLFGDAVQFAGFCNVARSVVAFGTTRGSTPKTRAKKLCGEGSADLMPTALAAANVPGPEAAQLLPGVKLAPFQQPNTIVSLEGSSVSMITAPSKFASATARIFVFEAATEAAESGLARSIGTANFAPLTAAMSATLDILVDRSNQ